MLVLVWYLVGLFIAYVLFLISNLIAEKHNDDRLDIKHLIFSWIFVVLSIVYIIFNYNKHKK